MNLQNLFRDADDVKEFPPGAIFFSEGTPGDVMYVVSDGELGVRTGSGFVDAIGSGDIVGEMALIDSEPRRRHACGQNCLPACTCR